MKRSLLILVCIAAGLICLQCAKPTDPGNQNLSSDDPPVRTPADMTAAEKSLAESTNRFSMQLFNRIAASEQPDENIFVSPLSVSYALGMTYNGAGGQTREAIASTLELAGLSIEEINESYRGLTLLLTALDPDVVFNIANSIWYRDGVPVEPNFIDLNRKYFDALVRALDFNADWAADTINHWVDVNTNGKIKDIVNPPIPWDVIMYLINAIYFKGNWTIPFDTTMTQEIPFYLGDGSIELRPAMMTDTNFQYFANDLFQAVELPYGDEYFCMTILLPRPSYTVDDIIGQLNDENWASWMASFADNRVLLSLPKFKFEYEINLNQMLKDMGMAIAFDRYAADFSNMVLNRRLWIDLVKQKAFVQVDETGTEAAAVTVVVVTTDCIPENPVMAVNRPFLFAIRERESGTILFMGKIADPEWQE